MIIEITKIEANAEELAKCNSLADGLTSILKRTFNPFSVYQSYEGSEEQEDD